MPFSYIVSSKVQIRAHGQNNTVKKAFPGTSGNNRTKLDKNTPNNFDDLAKGDGFGKNETKASKGDSTKGAPPVPSELEGKNKTAKGIAGECEGFGKNRTNFGKNTTKDDLFIEGGFGRNGMKAYAENSTKGGPPGPHSKNKTKGGLDNLDGKENETNGTKA